MRKYIYHCGRIILGIVFKSRINEFVQNVSEYGLGRSIIFYYYRFLTKLYNRKHNLFTDGISINKIKNSPPNKNHLMGTTSVVVPLIRKIFNGLQINTSDVLIDFGSSQGRALLIASEYNFKKIIGIEFLPDLCIIAKNNFNKYENSTGKKLNIKLIEDDVLNYHYNGDENVFYFYNPFDEYIMEKVLKSINISLKKHLRKVKLIYISPMCHKLILKYGFKNISKIDLITKTCYLYTN